MNARRINDILKLVGTIAAVISAIAPFAGKYSAMITAAGAFLAGIGTRGFGVEYQDVADAKAVAKASIMPPAMIAVVTEPAKS
jgi:hypothetical protein